MSEPRKARPQRRHARRFAGIARAVIAFALLAAWIAAPESACAAESAGPLVSFLGPSEAAVSWLPGSDGTALVGLRRPDSTLGLDLTASLVSAEGAAEFGFKALSPGAEYGYSLSCENLRQGPYAFRLPWERGFVAVAAGRTVGPWNRMIPLFAAMLETRPSLLLLPSAADDAIAGDPGTQRAFLDAAGQLLASVPAIYPRIEDSGTDSALETLFLRRGRAHAAVFEAGGVLFATVRPGWPADQDSRILGRLKEDLSREAEFRIALVPRPFFNSGLRGCDRESRRRILPVLIEAGVDLILSAGESSYERTKPAGLPNRGSLVQVSVGGVACVEALSPLPWTACHADGGHFLRIEKTPGLLEVSAHGPDGTILDRFELRPGSCRGTGIAGAVMLREPSLTDEEREAMKAMSEALDDLTRGLKGRERRELGRLAAGFRESAAKSFSKGFGDLSGFFSDIDREAEAISTSDLSCAESRVLAMIGLEVVRKTCGRCHGLFR